MPSRLKCRKVGEDIDRCVACVEEFEINLEDTVPFGDRSREGRGQLLEKGKVRPGGESRRNCIIIAKRV